jgi:hypothetical protein
MNSSKMFKDLVVSLCIPVRMDPRMVLQLAKLMFREDPIMKLIDFKRNNLEFERF